jgi:integrase/recombinase XerD
MAKTLSEKLDYQVTEGNITQTEADLIQAFVFEIQAQRGTSNRGIQTRVWSLTRVAIALHTINSSLDTVTTEDALKIIGLLRNEDYSKNYLNDLIKAFKRFLLWRIDNGVTGLNEKKIRAIKAPGMDWSAKKSSDMLTKEEVLKVIDACTNSRDRAIISMLYDGSLRPVDLRTLTWNDVTFDEFGAMIRTSAKTGKERAIRLTISTPYFAQWRTDYPNKPEGSAPVFLSHRVYKSAGEKHIPLEMDAIVRLIRSLRKKTGIEKLSPSILRPSRITHDVEDGYDSSYLMLKNWGTLKTPMLQVYAKPSEDYITKYAMEKAGIKTPQKIKERSRTLDPIKCPECETLNPAGKRFCGHCGHTLTEEAQTKVNGLSQELRSRLSKNPKAQKLFFELMAEMENNPKGTITPE